MSPMSPCGKSEGNGPLTPNYTVTTVSLCTLLEIHQKNSDLNSVLLKKNNKDFKSNKNLILFKYDATKKGTSFFILTRFLTCRINGCRSRQNV